MKEPLPKQPSVQRKEEEEKSPVKQAKMPPAFGLQAGTAQMQGEDKRGYETCTPFGDYFVTPDDAPGCYKDIHGEQITQSEFKKLQEAYDSIRNGSGDLIISETDNKGVEHGGFKRKTLDQIGLLMSKPMGRKLVLGILAGGKKVTIQPTPSPQIAVATRGEGSLANADGTANTGGTTTIQIDDNLTDDKVVAFDKAGKEIASPVFIILGHELIHARHNQAGLNQRNSKPKDAAFGNREEEMTIADGDLTENGLRSEHGIELRHGHSGKFK